MSVLSRFNRRLFQTYCVLSIVSCRFLFSEGVAAEESWISESIDDMPDGDELPDGDEPADESVPEVQSRNRREIAEKTPSKKVLDEELQQELEDNSLDSLFVEEVNKKGAGETVPKKLDMQPQKSVAPQNGKKIRAVSKQRKIMDDTLKKSPWITDKKEKSELLSETEVDTEFNWLMIGGGVATVVLLTVAVAAIVVTSPIGLDVWQIPGNEPLKNGSIEVVLH